MADAHDSRIIDALDDPSAAEQLSADERRQVEALRALERRVADAYAPSVSAMRAPTPPRRLRRAAVWLLVATGAIGGAWLLAGRVPMGDRLDLNSVHSGFVVNEYPSTVCDTPEKFLNYTTKAVGAPITADFDTDATLVGWRSPSGGYDGREHEPRVLLALDPDGNHIVVVFQHTSLARPRFEEDGGLRRFHQRFGDVHAWEITPNENPVVLQLLSLVNG